MFSKTKALLVLAFLAVSASVKGTFECPKDDVVNDSLCYVFVSQKMTFDEAESACANNGSHLALVNGFFANRKLSHRGYANFGVAKAWIGLQKPLQNASWIWVATEKPLKSAWWQNFVFKDDSDAEEEFTTKCVSHTVTFGTWNIEDCSQKLPFVCSVNLQ